MRTPVVFAFLASFIVFQPLFAQSSDPSAAATLQKAQTIFTEHRADSPSYRITADFHTFDHKGVSTGDGTVDELYQRGGNWRRTIVYNGHQALEVHRANEKTQFKFDDDYAETFAEDDMIRALFGPVPTAQSLSDATLTLRPYKAGTVTLSCITVSLPVKREDNSKYTVPNKVYCVEPDSGVLRMVQAHDGYAMTFNQIVHIGPTYFAKEIDLREHGAPRASLHVTKIEPNPAIPADAFAELPTPATDDDAAHTIASRIMAGRKLGGDPPFYPDLAKQNHIQGSVVLHAIIGRDGNIRDLELVSTPDDSLALGAMDAVRTWRYQPYLLDGKPVDVDTTITVNFSFSR